MKSIYILPFLLFSTSFVTASNGYNRVEAKKIRDNKIANSFFVPINDRRKQVTRNKYEFGSVIYGQEEMDCTAPDPKTPPRTPSPEPVTT